ncbi:MAG: LacI family DNA-binding transcriptional regulator [Verrucomicrobiota bacterium]
MPRPTLADIAARLGISKMSVSRALRGERHVSVDLRDRVMQAVSEIGYRPDPEIAKLMTHMRRSKRVASPITLAFVWAERDDEQIKTSSWSQELVRGAHQRAELLGYRLEEFHLKARGMTARRLSEILDARGIPGFILSPLISRSRGHVSMLWEKFSSVLIGLGYARPALSRVHHHHFFGMMTALRMLKKQGFRRIGFYNASTIDERMYRAWSASFLAHHPLPLAQAAELMCLKRETSRGDFQSWLKSAKPEVVIEGGHQLRSWFPLDGKVKHVTLGWRADHLQVPGIDQQAAVLGAAAVDLLVAQYQQNERGIPPYPKIVMTEGVWRPARS